MLNCAYSSCPMVGCHTGEVLQASRLVSSSAVSRPQSPFNRQNTEQSIFVPISSILRFLGIGASSFEVGERFLELLSHSAASIAPVAEQNRWKTQVPRFDEGYSGVSHRYNSGMASVSGAGAPLKPCFFFLLEQRRAAWLKGRARLPALLASCA